MIMKTICLVKKFGPDFPGDKFIEIFVLNQNGSRKATRFSGCYARAWSGLAGTVTRRWGYPRLASRAKPNRVRGESHWRQPERESRSQSPSLTATAPACSCIGPGSYRVSHERLERGTVDTSRRAWTWMTRSLAVARTPSPSPDRPWMHSRCCVAGLGLGATITPSADRDKWSLKPLHRDDSLSATKRLGRLSEASGCSDCACHWPGPGPPGWVKKFNPSTFPIKNVKLRVKRKAALSNKVFFDSTLLASYSVQGTLGKHLDFSVPFSTV